MNKHLSLTYCIRKHTNLHKQQCPPPNLPVISIEKPKYQSELKKKVMKTITTEKIIIHALYLKNNSFYFWIIFFVYFRIIMVQILLHNLISDIILIWHLVNLSNSSKAYDWEMGDSLIQKWDNTTIQIGMNAQGQKENSKKEIQLVWITMSGIAKSFFQ